MKVRRALKRIIKVLFVVFVPVIICAIFFYNNVQLVNVMKTGAISSEDMISTSLISDGLSLIAIAISVWIGLNIYNVVSKDEIEKAIAYSRKLDFTRNKELNKTLFRNELFKTSRRYLISEFFYNEVGDDDIFPVEYAEELIRFENLFCMCCDEYEANNYIKCQTICEELRVSYKQEISKIKTKDKRKFYWLEIYKLIREADILFYQNVTANKMDAEQLEDSIENYKTALNDYFENGKHIERDKKKLYMAYMYNSIGYTYYLLANEVTKQEDKDKYLNLSNDNMKKAIENNKENGRYWRNYGLYYERTAQYEMAIDCYKKSIKKDPGDYKAYNNVAASLLKDIGSRVNRDVYGRPMCDIKLVKSKCDEVERTLREAEDYLEMGVAICGTFTSLYANYVKLYIYRYLVSGPNTHKRNVIYAEQIQCYLRKIELLQKKPSLYLIRDYQEVLGNIKEANEINARIKEKKRNDDSANCEKIYMKYLEPKNVMQKYIMGEEKRAYETKDN